MTNEQINIKIAELCGWRQVHKPGLPGLIVGHAPKRYTGVKTHYQIEPAGDWWELPNYAADLNACHEFEKSLLTADSFCGHWEEYSNRLVALLGCTDIFHATARQRCEAFLRVHSQWEKKA